MVIATSCVDTENESYAPEKTTSPQTLLDEKIEYYRYLYPEIVFLILNGDDELPADMIALDQVLGYQPKSMDYEHPAELREDLMFVSVGRVELMLQSKMPSSSLFKTDTPLSQQEYICVLTINLYDMAADSIRSTQHLLELPQKVIQKIPKDLLLPPGDYLAFVIDHEIYHCLKSMYVGPQLMSHKKLWGEYNIFHNELGADAYALGMHIKTRDEDSIFAKNIMKIRGMALYNGDPDHLTCKALEQVLKIPSNNIAEMSAYEVFDMANRIKDRLTTDYDEYIRHLASKVQAMKELGVEEQISEEFLNKIKGIPADPKEVKALVANARRCSSDLCGNEFEQGKCE